MADPRINLKNRHLAALLAFLIPGAGHAYQGRYFKAVIYSVGILGLFFWGMAMADWKAVYFRWQELEPANRFRTPTRTIGYLSQVMVGVPSLVSLVQWSRYSSDLDRDARDGDRLDLPITAPFRGYVKHEAANDAWEGRVSGQLQLDLEDKKRPFGPEIRGHFRGVLDAGEHREVEFDLAGPVEIAPRLLGSGNVTLRLDDKNHQKEYSSSQRYISCRIVAPRGEFDSPVGQLEGTIPRAFWDWFQMPLEEDAVQELNGRLGRRYEIALLFTWVAGFLNLLAVWDALEGPAYGYGDEVELPEGEPSSKPESASTPISTPAPAASPARTPS